ncbi:MAG: DotU family type IV/VI secretion system protein [Planctomycetota bacterium]
MSDQPLELYDCVARYFLFLVTFRRNAGQVKMEEGWLRKSLCDLLAEAEARATSNPQLRARLDKARYALVALADEIVLDSAWEGRDSWTGHLLEEQFFGSAVSGAEFFERLKSVDAADADLNEIYFVCIALGFRGMYRSRPEELREVQQSLYLRIPDRVIKKNDQLCAQAYQYTIERDLTKLPTMKALTVGIVLLASIVVLWFTSWAIYAHKVSTLVKLADRGSETQAN